MAQPIVARKIGANRRISNDLVTPQPGEHEPHFELERPPKLPVYVHEEFVDFLHERGFPFEVISI